MHGAVRFRGGQTASFDVIQQSHDEFVLALCPGVVESHKSDFVEMILVLFASMLPFEGVLVLAYFSRRPPRTFISCSIRSNRFVNVKRYEQARPTQEGCSC